MEGKMTMNSLVVVLPSPAEVMAGGVNALPPEQVVPVDFAGVPQRVKVTFWQVEGTPVFGIGAYLVDDDREPFRGVVLRWNGSRLDAAPQVIHWQRPHCASDQCGSACDHRGR